jgi:hypothetical protein
LETLVFKAREMLTFWPFSRRQRELSAFFVARAGGGMTTIAWDGKTIACDTLAVNGHITQVPVAKLRESACGRWVYGITGFSAWFDAWIEWHASFVATTANRMTSMDAANCAPKWTGGDRDQGNFIAVDLKDGRVWQFGCDLPYPQECFAPTAWGSGENYAMGAMKAGADARRAVGVAIECDICSGGSVLVVDLQPPVRASKALQRAAKKALKGGHWSKAPLKAAEVDQTKAA